MQPASSPHRERGDYILEDGEWEEECIVFVKSPSFPPSVLISLMGRSGGVKIAHVTALANIKI